MNKNILLLILITLFLSCSKKNIIPEITPNLIDKKIHTLKNKANKKIFKFDSEIIFVDLKSKITKFNPEKEIITAIFQLTVKIDQNIIYQNRKLILRQKDADNFYIFDPQEMKIIKTLTGQKIDRILGIGNDIILYLTGKKLVIQNFKLDKVIKQIDSNSNTFFNCNFQGSKIYIFSNHMCYHYDKNRDVLSTKKLKKESTSEFLLRGKHLYYGSINRELIKLSLTRNKIKWKIKLPMILKLKPMIAGKYIVVTPEDNNIYFYKKKGTLYWWEKFSSTRLFPPVLMKDNVSVFQMNNEVKFFNFKNRKVITYKYKQIIDSNPVSINQHIYLLNHQKDKTKQKISKVGNNYTVEVRVEPKFIKPAGKSILFRLNPVNLIKPQFQINIFNQKKESMFSKKMDHSQLSPFIWIPQEAGKFNLVLEINSTNKNKLKIEKKIKTVDLKKILTKYIYNLQKKCRAEIMD